jgi:hypothetical protein
VALQVSWRRVELCCHEVSTMLRFVLRCYVSGTVVPIFPVVTCLAPAIPRREGKNAFSAARMADEIIDVIEVIADDPASTQSVGRRALRQSRHPKRRVLRVLMKPMNGKITTGRPWP